MKLGPKKRQLIYDCASEPVFQARIEISKLLAGHPRGDEIDRILAVAQGKAGAAAIAGCEANPLTHPTHRHVL